MDALTKLNTNLQEALEAFKKDIPNSEGLLIRDEIVQRTKHKVKSKKFQTLMQHKKYGVLKPQVKRGRKREDSKYRNRVGAKADKLRKVGHALLYVTEQKLNNLYHNVIGRKETFTKKAH